MLVAFVEVMDQCARPTALTTAKDKMDNSSATSGSSATNCHPALRPATEVNVLSRQSSPSHFRDSS